MKRIALSLIALFYIAGTAFAQSNKIDSLTKALKTAKEDTSKVNILNLLSKESGNGGNYDQAVKYASEAKTLAEKIGFNKGLAGALNMIGISNYRKGNYKEALKNHLEALKIREDIGDQQGIADSYNNIGLVYKNEGNYAEALKNYLLALKIYEQSVTGKRGIAVEYNNIGNIYLFQNNYSEALKNYTLALNAFKQINEKHGIASAYGNIGAIYKNQNNYDSALVNYFRALAILQETGTKGDLPFAYNNIGVIYEEKGNYPDALKNYFMALKILEESGNKHGVSGAYINIGSVYIKQKKISDAKKYLQDGLQLSKETGDKDDMKECYINLAELADSTQDYKNAYLYYKLFSEIKDTLLNESSSKQINEMKTKYETEKKDKEIEIQTIKIDKQKTAEKYLIAGFSLLVIFVLIYFRLYNQRRKVAFKHEILETKMQALRAQMNPHFTFNILNSIQYYAGENDMKAVQHYLRQFSKLIRMILDQSRTSYITLEQEITMLKLYLELEEMRFEKKFDYVVDIAENLNPAKILIPGMLIQPIVENAIKHGIEHKEGEALIKISFYSKNSTLVCSVTDNGIGRAEATRLKSGNELHTSAATSIINERMEALSSIYNIHLECKTEDLFDQTGEVAGTRVTMEMPIQN